MPSGAVSARGALFASPAGVGAVATSLRASATRRNRPRRVVVQASHWVRGRACVPRDGGRPLRRARFASSRWASGCPHPRPGVLPHRPGDRGVRRRAAVARAARPLRERAGRSGRHFRHLAETAESSFTGEFVNGPATLSSVGRERRDRREPSKTLSADRGWSGGPELLSRPDRLNGPGAERSSGWQRKGQEREER